ncbi:uncharacterized protein PV09_02502 [Verruconis gallopava]|uniref:CENP-V/GFA domain-containing protein n=1 Tax=Verruconis gallopava TaxID=253628 RepID=A0A0D1Z1L2_9PEZI|nr:uncharacterized protein PV09_02502 [Verruconis gallopava]KIW06822.1 hypothetical protein PV09_02502 [Verruconis gallopava]
MSAAAKAGFSRKPYVGSCHCGTIKYIAYITLPASPDEVSTTEFYEESGVRLYKCNCNTCQKMGIFHLRLKSPGDDFVLLSPLDPHADDSGMTKYMTPAKRSSWWFCKTCGVRCFTIRGPTEQAEVEVPAKSLEALGIKAADVRSDSTVKVKAWKPKDEFVEKAGGGDYLSINAVTLNPQQEGLDLALFHEKQWVAYVDSLNRKAESRFGKPHPGGIY